MLEAVAIAFCRARLECSQVLANELFFRRGIGVFRLLAPCELVELVEPFPKTSLSNRSVRCLEASAVFDAVTSGTTPKRLASAENGRHALTSRDFHQRRNSTESNVHLPRGQHWRAPGILPARARRVQWRR